MADRLKRLVEECENCVHDTKGKKVTWTSPPDLWIIINTDGSAINNRGKIGDGGILRDQSSKHLMAFTTPL